jgi:hypothetical protein
VDGGVVVVFDPVGELAVEGVEGGEVELLEQEAVADAAEEALDLALGGAVAHGGVAEQGADAGADLVDLRGGVDGAVVHVEGLGEAAFVEGAAQAGDEVFGVLGEEELAVGDDAAGVVDEGDELGLGGAAAVFEEGAEHRVHLPHFVGVLLGKGQAALVGGLVQRSEQVVGAHEAEEAGLGAGAGGEQAAFDATAVDHHFVMAGVAEVREDLFDGLAEQLGGDFAVRALVGAGARERSASTPPCL